MDAWTRGSYTRALEGTLQQHHPFPVLHLHPAVEGLGGRLPPQPTAFRRRRVGAPPTAPADVEELTVAALAGEAERVRELLDGGSVGVNDVDGDGFSALQMATEGGHREVVRLLLEAGATSAPPTARRNNFDTDGSDSSRDSYDDDDDEDSDTRSDDSSNGGIGKYGNNKKAGSHTRHRRSKSDALAVDDEGRMDLLASTVVRMYTVGIEEGVEERGSSFAEGAGRHLVDNKLTVDEIEVSAAPALVCKSCASFGSVRCTHVRAAAEEKAGSGAIEVGGSKEIIAAPLTEGERVVREAAQRVARMMEAAAKDAAGEVRAALRSLSASNATWRKDMAEQKALLANQKRDDGGGGRGANGGGDEGGGRLAGGWKVPKKVKQRQEAGAHSNRSRPAGQYVGPPKPPPDPNEEEHPHRFKAEQQFVGDNEGVAYVNRMNLCVCSMCAVCVQYVCSVCSVCVV